MVGSLLDPNLLRVHPSVSLFLLRYLRRFRIREAGGHLVVHSHLPPLGSRPFRRFTALHLADRVEAPTHAQVGVTAVCPQRCPYCYNKGRAGETLDRATLRRLVNDLADMGVVWLGFTGGEPLLSPHLDELIELAADRCAVKVFTTGDGLTAGRARALARAGCFSVAVSLDDWREQQHDEARGVPGAYRTAIAAIRAALDSGALHVSVSSVVAPSVIRDGRVGELLGFLRDLGVHEAWLSEVKPAWPSAWGRPTEFTEDDRLALERLQDAENRKGGMTVNYLGHFEGAGQFGCNAGRRMVYVDAWGEVCPCVFAPLSFGNVRDEPVGAIYRRMRGRFASQSACFVQVNHPLFARAFEGTVPLAPAQSARLVGEATFTRPSAFMRIFERDGGRA